MARFDRRNRPWYLTWRRWRWGLLGAAVVIAVVAIVVLPRIWGDTTQDFGDDLRAHFLHGSIGSEPESGLPYWIFKALPTVFAEEMGPDGWKGFGFLFPEDPSAPNADIPYGFSKRRYLGVDIVWMNCAACHLGTYRESADAEPRLVPGMPAKSLDLYRFIRFVLDAAVDPRMSADVMMPAMEAAGADFDWFDRLWYRYAVMAIVDKKLKAYREALLAMMSEQPPWGPGRVDSFNPYKTLIFMRPYLEMRREQTVGTVDIPALFNQAERAGMHLHWDGNNISLVERNLFASLGAGVRENTVDLKGIAKATAFMMQNRPPKNPALRSLDRALAARGRAIYMRECAECHGWQGDDGYVFGGGRLGQVEFNASRNMGVDPARMESFTQLFTDLQGTQFTKYPTMRFRYFRQTDGYANPPLDGLWLRGPYLHNGSVPTVRDLLEPPARRPKAFRVGGDVLDMDPIGFVAEPCTPLPDSARDGSCRDTTRDGNRNVGHTFGVDLPRADKDAMIEYMKTF